MAEADIFDAVPVGPTGRYCLLPPVVGQKPLRFFLPNGLDELIAKNSVLQITRPDADIDALYAMIPIACRKKQSAIVDKNYAALAASILANQVPLTGLDDLIDLGKRITSKNTSLRRELAFTRLSTVAPEFMAYPHHDLLSAAVDSIILAKKTYTADGDSMVVSCLTNFYSAHIHPFSDGNGRWSRLLALHFSIISGDMFSAFSSFLFHNLAGSVLIEKIWPKCRSDGFKALFGTVYSFETSLRVDAELNRCLGIYSNIYREFIRKAPSAHIGRRLMLGATIDSKFGYEQVRTHFGFSNKACIGLLERAREIGGDFCFYHERDLDIAALMDEIASTIYLLCEKLLKNL